MSKGSGSDERAGMSLSQPGGDALVDQVFLARAAVENWSRFADGPSDMIQARFALLDAIRESGIFSPKQPDWMTSAKPGIDAYIHLPDNLSLTLIRDPKGTDERPWLAKNCIAPRRGSRRRETTPTVLDRAAWTDADLAQLLQMSGQEVAERSKVSAHCIERFMERMGVSANSEEIEQIVASGTIMLPPDWARMTGRTTPVCLVYTDDDELAFAITPNTSPADLAYPYVIATVLSRRWVDMDLLALTGQDLADRIKITSGAIQSFARSNPDTDGESLLAVIRDAGQPRMGDSGPVIEIPGGALTLHSGSTGRGTHDWLARDFIPS